jgi:hypothetical protein
VDGQAFVVEAVVEATEGVLDPLVDGPAGTGAVDEPELVGDLVADERQRVVVKVGEVDLVGTGPGADRRAGRIDGLDDGEVVAEMQPRTEPARGIATPSPTCCRG